MAAHVRPYQKPPPAPQTLQRDSVDILQNMGMGLQSSRYKSPGPASASRPDSNEYALKDYRNRTASPAQLQSEMLMRPTVMPKELREVKKHETVQKILRNQKGGGDGAPGDSSR